MTIALAIVGCGGMGHRHLYGLCELQNAGLNGFELCGACDPVRENAESLRAAARQHLDRDCDVAGSLDELASQCPGLEAVDITADPRHHHTLAVEAIRRGWHVMVEKPMGLTVKACHLIVEAASRSDRILSVAENYRRDPMNRLAKALLDGGAIGRPRLFLQHTVDGADRMVITPWRHRKDRSGLLVDVGVHYADVMAYFLGPIDTVYAQTRLYERVRQNPLAGCAELLQRNVYARWQKDFPARFACPAEDAAYAVMGFASGAVAQLTEDRAGRGASLGQRIIFGSRGSLQLPAIAAVAPSV